MVIVFHVTAAAILLYSPASSSLLFSPISFSSLADRQRQLYVERGSSHRTAVDDRTHILTDGLFTWMSPLTPLFDTPGCSRGRNPREPNKPHLRLSTSVLPIYLGDRRTQLTPPSTLSISASTIIVSSLS